MKKNLISVMFVLVLLVSFSTALAMGGPGFQGTSGGSASGGNQAHSQSQTQKSENQSNSQQPEMGMNNRNHQDGQNADKCGGGLEALAAYLEIDTTDLTAEEVAAAIKTAVETLNSTALSALADEMDIDATDMTEAEILAAVEAVLTPPTPHR